MKKFFGIIAVSALALAGCSKDYCDEFADAGNDYAKKAKDCDDGSTTTTTYSDAQLKQCNESVEKSCTATDKDVLEKTVSCLDSLPTCTAANKDSFGTSSFACVLNLAGLSEGCQKALDLNGD